MFTDFCTKHSKMFTIDNFVSAQKNAFTFTRP